MRGGRCAPEPVREHLAVVGLYGMVFGDGAVMSGRMATAMGTWTGLETLDDEECRRMLAVQRVGHRASGPACSRLIVPSFRSDASTADRPRSDTNVVRSRRFDPPVAPQRSGAGEFSGLGNLHGAADHQHAPPGASIPSTTRSWDIREAPRGRRQRFRLHA